MKKIHERSFLSKFYFRRFLKGIVIWLNNDYLLIRKYSRLYLCSFNSLKKGHDISFRLFGFSRQVSSPERPTRVSTLKPVFIKTKTVKFFEWPEGCCGVKTILKE